MKSCKVLLFLHCKFCILYFLPYIPSDISFLSVILRNFTFSLALFKIFLISSKGNPSSNRPPFAALALRIRLVVRLFALAINGSWLLRWRGRGQSFSGGGNRHITRIVRYISHAAINATNCIFNMQN